MTRIHACLTIALVLACVLARFPSWPLAFAVAIVAGLALALLILAAWEADRLRGANALVDLVNKHHEAIREHAEAIADLKHSLVMRKIDSEAPREGLGTSFPGFPR